MKMMFKMRILISRSVALWLHCSTAPLLRCSTAPLLHCSVAPLLHCSTAPSSQFLFLQKRDTQKHIFAFTYFGTFDIEIWKERQELGLHSVELCKGKHDYHYALIKVTKKKRAGHVQKILESYDKEVTPGMQIKLTSLPNEPHVIGFGYGHEFMNHIIYREIERSFKEVTRVHLIKHPISNNIKSVYTYETDRYF